MLIVRGSAYSVKGRNTGLEANLRNPEHYPVEALCRGCRRPVRREKPDPGRLDWEHIGRQAGEP
jgi:hypothetical protein